MFKRNSRKEPKLSRREAWQAVADRVDGEFVAGKRSSGDQVHVDHGPWSVRLDTYTVSTGQTSVTYTRVRSFYVARDDFTLRISRRHVGTWLAGLFGAYPATVGDADMDEKYIVKSSNEARTRSFLMDTRLRELVKVQPSLRLEVRRLSRGQRKEMGEGVRAVAVQTTGVVKDPERLENYIRLVAQALDQLVRVGAAAEEPVAPGRIYALRHRL